MCVQTDSGLREFMLLLLRKGLALEQRRMSNAPQTEHLQGHQAAADEKLIRIARHRTQLVVRYRHGSHIICKWRVGQRCFHEHSHARTEGALVGA